VQLFCCHSSFVGTSLSEVKRGRIDFCGTIPAQRTRGPQKAAGFLFYNGLPLPQTDPYSSSLRMKRDLDLMREILLKVEAGTGQTPLFALKDLSDSPADIGYNVTLLKDAAFVEANLISFNGPDSITGVIVRMTNAGHDYLDSVRDPKIWKKTKSVLENVGGSAALEVVKETAIKITAELIKHYMGGP
jgi:Hypothetical protein (DUF2513)